MDPTAPSITFFDKDTGKGRATYIGACAGPDPARRPHFPHRKSRPTSEGPSDSRGN